MTNLQDLRERVAGATGADRELDALIECFFDPEWEPSSRFSMGCVQKRGHDGWIKSSKDYSESVDAALALIERVLPGYRVVMDSDHDRAPLWGAMVRPSRSDWPPRSFSPTPALALISALLAAVETNPPNAPSNQES